ncbi:group II intron maturase-specific domain-containing protein [Mesonia sediminis]|uniref:Group II intron maturase-specific domain-containing protein n=1 Tax=Mesonia sediminis TaxID=1703946 RepID=A0ABW5SDW8_9FLAO
MAGSSKWKEFKAKFKYLPNQTIPASFEERIQRINLLLRGWINYFRPASIQGKLKKLEYWLRNRLQYCIWSRSFGSGVRGALRHLKAEPTTRLAVVKVGC